MYKRRQQGWSKHLDFIILDAITLAFSLIFAYIIRHGSIKSFFSSRLYWSILMVIVILDVLISILLNSMHNVINRGYLKELTETLKQDMIVFGSMLIYLFTVKDSNDVSRIVLWLTLFIQVVLSYGVRLLWKRHVISRHAHSTQNPIVLIADSDEIESIIERFRESPLDNMNIIGIIDADGKRKEDSICGIPVVCSMEDAPEFICREWIDEVYISTAVPPRTLLDRCMEMGVTTHLELRNTGGKHQVVESIAGRYVVTSSLNFMTPLQMFAKRMLDIMGGLVGSLIALLIIAIVGPRIKRESPGPILFKQERIGQNGKHFIMPKIRSMYMDAEARKAELMKDNRMASNMMFKVEWDPRIIGNEILPDGTRKTGIGEFIRRTSLDEFPQFFCVLRGTMSLVGTRPPTVDEWENYDYHHRARLSTKPGITGMWQVNGRSLVTDFEEVVKLDTEYINNWSFGLDIRILLKTIVSVIKHEGAM